MFINRSKSKSNTNEKSYIPQYEGSKLYNFESKLSDIKPLKFEEDKPFSFSQKNIDFKISSNGKCESKNEIYDPS